jgi:hypothetical protein
MKLVGLMMASMLAVQPVLASDARPTEESVKQLFEVMHTSQIIDTYITQINTTIHASMRQAMQGKPLNAEQQQIMDDWGSELVALMRHELDWQTMQPMMVEVYRANFNQEEVDGMLKFYRSPTGQSMISKLPAAMQQAMQTMQQRAATLTPKIQQLTQDTMAALKRAQDRAATSSAPPPQSPAPPQSSPPPPAPPAPASAPPPAAAQ